MSRYLYRCDCGNTHIHEQSVTEPVPETVELGEHPAGPPGESRTLCVGMHRRVFETANVNLGFREVKHTDNEGYLFKHLTS